MKMFLRDNCIHGDMHAGNVLFCPQTGLVTVIDAGVVCEVEESWRRKFHEFLLALCTGDAASAKET
jgi:predicted unusual protein kinase regulating ubiquinone biosynthesis (AarF/ABC1/UbiB family)